jgi:integrase
MVPYWFADKKAIDGGYVIKSANLSAYGDNPVMLVKQAQRLQSEMLLWMKGATKVGATFDGAFKSLFEIYETDPESTIHALKPGILKIYLIYLKKLRAHIGDVKIATTDGRAVKRWFAEWRFDEDGSEHLPRARMVLAVLKATVRFGIICRLPGCSAFKEVLSELEFDRPKARTAAATSEQIVAARKAAHANGAPHRALVYALQFDTRVRQWDLIGQWLPMSDPKFSTITDRNAKWVGPMWSAVGDKLIFSIKPTKTEDTTEVEVSFDLSVCPMVMEELAMFPEQYRKGPMIKNPMTNLPYRVKAFTDGWRKDFKDAGLPLHIWNRDLRASAVTADRKAGASKDDVRKLAGHAKEETTEIYDRDTIEAHRRVMAARKAFEGKNAS